MKSSQLKVGYHAWCSNNGKDIMVGWDPESDVGHRTIDKIQGLKL